MKRPFILAMRYDSSVPSTSPRLWTITKFHRLDSDIDLLVEFDSVHDPGMIPFARMALEPTKLLAGRKVDLGTSLDLTRCYRGEMQVRWPNFVAMPNRLIHRCVDISPDIVIEDSHRRSSSVDCPAQKLLDTNTG